MRAVRYHRLSTFHEESTSIPRQEAETAERVAREGWRDVASLSDPNISGAKARRNAQAALAMLREGQADVLVVAAFDRWSRMGLTAVAELVEVLDERERSGSPALFVALREGIRSDAPGWRITAVVIAEVARQERENTSARVTASIARLTDERRFRGGTTPYGYRAERDPDGPGFRLVVDEAAAEVVREVARRVLAGASVWAVANDLNDRQVPTRLSGAWSVSRLTRMLTSPRIIGQVIYRDEVVRDGEGVPVQFWPPVLDLETWERLRVRLGADRPRDEPRPRGRRAARLLSGVLTCRGCGRVLYVNSVRAQPAYQCDGHRRTSTPQERCPAPVSIRAEAVEEHIVSTYLAAYGEAPAYERVVIAPEDVGLSEVLRAIEGVTEALKRSPDVATFQRLQSLSARRDALQAAPRTQRVELRPTGRTVREMWETAEGLAERRELLRAAYGVIAVGPATKTGRYAPVAPRISLVASPAFVAGASAEGYSDGRPVVLLDNEDAAAWDDLSVNDVVTEA